MRMARVGVLLNEKATKRRWTYGMNVFGGYVGEILTHAGIPFVWLSSVNEVKDKAPDILIVALMEEDNDSIGALWEYVEQGGYVISYAGLNRMAGKMDCLEKRSDSPGYARLPETLADTRPLRYLQAKPWVNRSDLGQTTPAGSVLETIGILHQDHPAGPELAAALLNFTVGRGKLDRWNVDIPYTVVGMQQGTAPVVEDGIPAEDGTGTLDEGILKADDRCELDWMLDRLHTETGTPYYAHPYADLWREAMIRHLLGCALDLGLTLPFVGLWPDGIRHVAMISHDSDTNLDESAESTLQVLEECGIRSTWCMLEPGYGGHIYEQVKVSGHELAFHYNALEQENGVWAKDEFSRQLDWLKGAADITGVMSNKNHYTRFEGWGELFQWCEAEGIEADQTRGPSKKGNIGFLFGTCHPYRPIAWSDEQNRLYNVLEIGFLTQDLEHPSLADTSVIVPFLEQVMRVEGVAHFLFHQIHILRQPNVPDALRAVVREARQRGFVFWTCGEINEWERSRRKVRILEVDGQGSAVVENRDALSGAVVWIPVAKGGQRNVQSEHDSVPLEWRYGVLCRKQQL